MTREEQLENFRRDAISGYFAELARYRSVPEFVQATLRLLDELQKSGYRNGMTASRERVLLCAFLDVDARAPMFPMSEEAKSAIWHLVELTARHRTVALAASDVNTDQFNRELATRAVAQGIDWPPSGERHAE